MRITNRMMINNSLANINVNKNQMNTMDTQLSTQKKISRPSEDPIIAIRALRFRSNLNEIEQYLKKNIPDARSWMSVTEGAMNQADEIINDFLRYGDADVSESYLSAMKQVAEQYVQELFQKLRDYDYNEDLMKLYVMGGGARMVEMFGKYNTDRTTFNHDICANAKGYEYFCYMMLRQKNRK